MKGAQKVKGNKVWVIGRAEGRSPLRRRRKGRSPLETSPKITAHPGGVDILYSELLQHTSMKSQNAAQIFNTFINLTEELKSFADVSHLKIAFDREGRVYLTGNDFSEEIKANFQLHREVSDALRDIIARRCGRVFPADNQPTIAEGSGYDGV